MGLGFSNYVSPPTSGIATACITDVLLHKVIFRWELLEQLPYSKVEIYTTVSKGIRWVTLIYATLYWIKAMLSYQPPAQAMLKEMSRIRKILTPCIVYPHIVSDSDCDHIEGGHARGYTLDDFVELFGDRSDSSYVYESGYTSEETDDEFLGEDSEDLVEEYLESKEKRRRHNTSARMNPNYKQI
ncbi:transcription factor bHLH113-like isoform X1, putative [Babesia ovis]|uniref:Transcription factor bHLH113-like isoform X1, putative n=1 Tax=Babesia ovis TaxID=5869 RepID=A0A9W5TEU4_BABOV|nr:transcription factor bHLH113-like isoform X1, putative [Babesia ovis]